jgi:hypothetical protein
MVGAGSVSTTYPAGTSEMLSVAEIQLALRELRAQHCAPDANTGHPHAPDGRYGAKAPEADTVTAAGDDDPKPGRLASGWIAVASAHAGAGASCVALLLADALAQAGRPTRLIEVATPARAGLAGAADTELGLDESGCWRMGRRGAALLCRRTGDEPPQAWPGRNRRAKTVVDVGLPSLDNAARLAQDAPLLVLVCRASVPGVRATEHLLDQLSYPNTDRLVVAAIGAKRWPGQVAAATGRRLGELRAAGRVVRVPTDRRLELAGPTCGPLPRQLLAAGRQLLDRIGHAEHGGDQTGTAGPSDWKDT